MRRPFNAGVDSGADHTHLTAQITMKMKAACACISFDSRSNYSKTKIWQVAIAIKFMNEASPSSVICPPPLANPYSPPTAFFLHWRPGFQPSDAERDCSAGSAEGATAPETLRPKDRHRFDTHSEECPNVIVRRAYRRSKRAAPSAHSLVNLSGPEQRGRSLRILRGDSTL